MRGQLRGQSYNLIIPKETLNYRTDPSGQVIGMSEHYKYLFGPVPSRRLGRSLGVDLIPFKTCTMDCTYCQLGETPCAVSERGDYVPMQDVLAELEIGRAHV